MHKYFMTIFPYKMRGMKLNAFYTVNLKVKLQKLILRLLYNVPGITRKFSENWVLF